MGLIVLAIEWHRGAARVHERVLETGLDSLVAQLAHLHRPFYCDGELPTCHGCDADTLEADDPPAWPCRTYTILAKATLGVSDVEELLVGLGRQEVTRRAAPWGPAHR